MHEHQRKRLTLQTPHGALELAYRDRGRGEPLLLLHGFFGNGDDWAHLPGIDEGARGIALDLRGHGHSTNPSALFRFHDAADDVLQLLDHLGVAQCRAVGLSGGALTLLRMAIMRPTALSSMVLVSACDGFPPQARAFMAASSSESAQQQAAAELGARHPRGGPQVESLFAAARAFANGDDDAQLSTAELASIRARTLIVSGDRDPLYPLDVALRLYRGIPDAQLWVVPDGGHTPVFGAASAEFVARAQRFGA